MKKYYDIKHFKEPLIYIIEPYYRMQSGLKPTPPVWYREILLPLPQGQYYDKFVDLFLPSYDEIKTLYIPNDSYFLDKLRNTYTGDGWDDDPYMFRDILAHFYFLYEGNHTEWLQHTMDITRAFNDHAADSWLMDEIKQPLKAKKIIKAGIIIRRHIDEIEACKHGDQKPLLKKLAEQYGIRNSSILKTELSRYRKRQK